MELSHITYQGSQFDEDSCVLAMLPENLVGLLRQINGFVQFEGGLHIRGVCAYPAWHSLDNAMLGKQALHRLYAEVLPSDVPFGQDCVADQFLLRDGIVHKLESETGRVSSLAVNLRQFFEAVESDPVEYLAMQPLLRFKGEGGALEPGQVLHAYPPFCSKEAENGVSLRAVAAEEALSCLADFSRQLGGVAEGQRFYLRVVA